MIDAGIIRAGLRILAPLLADGPAARANLLDGSGPWSNRKLVRTRYKAQDALQESARTNAMAAGQKLVAGKVDPAAWADKVVGATRAHIVAAAQLGAGTPKINDALTTRHYLNSLFQSARDRFDALARKAADGLATEKQVAAWAYQTAGGLSRAAFVLGGLEGEDGPVRRLLLTESQHCTTCPPKARTYASLEECQLFCGGLPGDGSDECYGNCNCTIEPASRASVYADLTRSPAATGFAHWAPKLF